MKNHGMFQNKRLKITVAIMLGLVLCMSIGYAAFSTKLNINGTGNVKGARWSIHYVSGSVKILSDTSDDLTNITGDNVTEAATINTDLNDITFGITMPYKSKYEFTVDITNDGSFDGEIKAILLTTTKGTNSAVSTSGNTYSAEGITYKVTYSDGTDVKISDILKVGETKTLKFSAKYLPASDSVTTDTAYKFSASVEYTQSSGLAPGEEVDVPYEITYVPNGGTVTTTSKYVNKGSALGTLQTPTKANATFLGWYSDAALTKEVDENYVPTGNMSLYAKYNDDYVITIAAENYKYTSADKIYVKKGLSIGTFPTVTFKSGYQLDNWYSDSAYTNKINTAYTPTSDTTIYAKSKLVEGIDVYYKINDYLFKATGTDGLFLLSNVIGTGTWSEADTNAKAFMATYNSRLMTVAEANVMSQSERVITTAWWLADGGSGNHVGVCKSGAVDGSSGDFGGMDSNPHSIRPVISLAGVSFIIDGGTGTSDDPYIILVQ